MLARKLNDELVDRGSIAVTLGLTGVADTRSANMLAYACGSFEAGPEVCTISSARGECCLLSCVELKEPRHAVGSCAIYCCQALHVF